jgi:hypothetical protein
MSKIVIACISFAAGVIITIGALRIEVVLAQSSERIPDTDPEGHRRPVLDHIGIVGPPGSVSAGTGVGMGMAGLEDIPKFEPLTTRPIFKNSTFTDEGQVLDGLDCRSCAFKDARLVYGGGPFNLEDARFSGKVSLQLTGAAANTVAMLKFVGLLEQPNAPIVQPQNNKPIERQSPIRRKPNHSIDFGPPFVGRE